MNKEEKATHLKSATYLCLALEDHVLHRSKNFLDSLRTYDLDGLYQLKSGFWHSKTGIESPRRILTEHEKKYELREEYQFYLDHSNIAIELVKECAYEIHLEQVKRRGYIDSALSKAQKLTAMTKSVETINQELSRYNHTPEIAHNLSSMLSALDTNELLDMIVVSELNFTNKDATRYLLFETLLLAPIRFWHNQEGFKEDHAEKEKHSKNVKKGYAGLNWKLPEQYDKLVFFVEGAKGLKGKLPGRNQGLTYVRSLYHEYLGLDFKKLKKFLYVLCSGGKRPDNSKIMKDPYRYLGTKEENGLTFVIEKFPVPMKGLIADFSKM